MSAWYDSSVEEQRENKPFDDMNGECDYGVINYGSQKLPALIVEGEEQEGEYSLSDMDVDSQEDTGDGYWNPYLYQLQLQAPRPSCIACLEEVPNRPACYGEEYHGSITHEECGQLLGQEDGNYLVRAGLRNPGTYSLSFVFEGRVRHFRLFYETGQHYTGDKTFDTVEELVADGLITLHMDKHNVLSYIEESLQQVTQTVPTPPALPPVNGTPRRQPHTEVSTFGLQKRDKPGRASLRPLGGWHSSSSRVYSVHGDSQLPDNQVNSLAMSFDDSDLGGHKRGGSLRLFKAKSVDKKKGSPAASNLSLSCTTADFLSLDSGSSAFKKSASFSDKHSSSLARAGIVRQSPIRDDDLRSSLSDSKLLPLSPKASMDRRVVSTNGDDPQRSQTSPAGPPVLKSNGDYSYFKPHNFKPHSWLGFRWCDLCHNFIYGIKSHGFECTDCGFSIHKQCKDAANFDCIPQQNKFKKLFGVDLTIIVKMYNTKTPVVLKHCISEVEKRGLAVEGIYRMAGQNDEIHRIKEEFDKGQLPDLGIYQDVHAICSVLKLYLRELPIPLIAYDVYNLCLIAVRCSTEVEKKEKLRLALKRVSKPHYNSLKNLVEHLHKVELFHHVNKMTARNLAVVFAPTLIRSPNQPNADQFTDMKRLPEHREIIELLICNKKYFFP